MLAATNWNGDLAGREVEPGELRDQMLDAMRQDRGSSTWISYAPL